MENVNDRVTLQILDTAYNRRIRTFAIVNNEHININDFLNDAIVIYKSELLRALEE